MYIVLYEYKVHRCTYVHSTMYLVHIYKVVPYKGRVHSSPTICTRTSYYWAIRGGGEHAKGGERIRKNEQLTVCHLLCRAIYYMYSYIVQGRTTMYEYHLPT